MKTVKGMGIFLAQFAGDNAPFNILKDISRWAASLGYKGVQIPTWDNRLFDMKRAAESKTYCDELRGILAANHVELTELSTHLQGQLVAVHPAHDQAFDGFAPEAVQPIACAPCLGHRATEVLGEGLSESRAECARDIFRALGMDHIFIRRSNVQRVS